MINYNFSQPTRLLALFKVQSKTSERDGQHSRIVQNPWWQAKHVMIVPA